jgi:isopentenyl-diphosphate Delta-isomerase
MAKVIIVNEKDEQIGLKDRKDIKKDDIYRVSALWIKNSKGDILLAQRALTKKNNPGMWGPAVAGTNEEGETYESNIIKEAEEELGLKNVNFKKGPKIIRHNAHSYFCQWFTLKIDKKIDKFTIQKEEVEKIAWFKKETLLKDIKTHPDKFLKKMDTYVGLFS